MRWQNPAGGLAVLGALLGGVIGFILRPSYMLIGQLPFGAVMTRGATLNELDKFFLLGAARTSFNYVLTGVLAGLGIGIVVGLAIAYALDRYDDRESWQN